MRLERDVAIKTLPDVFANDPDRRERFEREAQVLASLNHPHIAQIYGFEQSGSECYIAMELVEGETLADRLVHGPLAPEDAVTIAKGIATALEAAHEKGIVHRDLKPGNIKLTPDGQVKVLDFGLAKAVGEEPHLAVASHSPTISPAATQAGVLLGTAAYMSPEQAKGRPVDRRADIWAFGVVVFEMLTGRGLFAGQTTTETLAQVMMQEIEWQALPRNMPPALVRLLQRCLVKDPRNRLQAIGDARIELDAISTGAAEQGVVDTPSIHRSRILGWSLASAFLGASAAAAVFVAWPRETTVPAPVSRWTIQLPPGERIAAGNVKGGLGIGRPSVAVSPDDRHVVYVVERDGETMLHVRALHEFEGKPIPGTEGGFQPFFAPDGQWVGFFTDTRLKKVFLQGGAPVTLADAVHVYGASWATDDRIYYGDREGHRLTRIAASGGQPEVIANSTGVGAQLMWPHVLPGARAMLFNSLSPVVSVLSLEDGKSRALIAGASARYVATGHLVFSRGSDVLAAPFDLERLAVAGPAVPVLQNVRTEALDAGQFSISQRGTLVYVPGGFARHVRLVWLDRQGRETPINVPSQIYGAFELSPDGRRAAIVVPAQGEGQTNDVWIYDLERDTRTRLTARGVTPIWTPDGTSVIFGLEGDGVNNIHRLAVDGADSPERLVNNQFGQSAQAVSPDGRTLIYTENDAQGDRNLWSVRLDGERKPQPVLQTPAREVFADFSPDGRWLAYVNDASGRYEVYVMRSDGTGERRQVSTEGGEEPRWSARGDELFYRYGETWMAVAVTQGTRFTAGRPQKLFEGPFPNVPGYSYDVSPDGRRFLMAREATTGYPTQIRVVLNWYEELTQRVTAARTP